MITKLVRPILIKSKENTEIILGVNITRNIPGDLRGQNYELILISLENEKIEVGDEVCDGKYIEKAITDYYIISKKVIAHQSQISPELIQHLIAEYNSGDMKDFEIEMEPLTHNGKSNGFNICTCGFKKDKEGYLTCTKEHLQPKLTNGFVTPVVMQYSESRVYTEEDVKKIFAHAIEIAPSSESHTRMISDNEYKLFMLNELWENTKDWFEKFEKTKQSHN